MLPQTAVWCFQRGAKDARPSLSTQQSRDIRISVLYTLRTYITHNRAFMSHRPHMAWLLARLFVQLSIVSRGTQKTRDHRVARSSRAPTFVYTRTDIHISHNKYFFAHPHGMACSRGCARLAVRVAVRSAARSAVRLAVQSAVTRAITRAVVRCSFGVRGTCRPLARAFSRRRRVRKQKQAAGRWRVEASRGAFGSRWRALRS